MSKTKTKNNYPNLSYEIEALNMELEDVQLQIDVLRDQERYLKVEIEKAEAKVGDEE